MPNMSTPYERSSGGGDDGGLVIAAKSSKELEHLTPLQKEILAIYKEFKRICDKHGLRYYADSGTAIGALREGGFIPWDDDLDVLMPFRDVEELFRIWPEEAAENLRIFWFRFDGTMVKITNTDSTFIEWNVLTKPKDYEGVFIDIFPMIGTPDDDVERQSFEDELERVRLEAWTEYMETNVKTKQEEYWELCNKFDYDKSQFVCRSCVPHGWSMTHQDFATTSSERFEDTVIPMPSNITAFLKRYGDYMQLPPETERVSHHEEQAFVDLSRPYKYYGDMLAEVDGKLLKSIQDTLTKYNYQTYEYLTTQVAVKGEQISSLQQQISSLQQQIDGIFNSKRYKLGTWAVRPYHLLTKIYSTVRGNR